MPITIHNTEIHPGEQAQISIPAGRLPTGRQVQVRVQVRRAKDDGPVVLLLGGMHGDEVNGVETIRQAMSSDWVEELQCGTLIAMPVLNVYGFINGKREVPDGKDINRSFPGSSRGSLAARLARIMHRKVLPLVDWGIDFHTGADQTYNYPQIRYTTGDPEALRLGRAFGAPYLLAKSAIPKSLRKVAMAQSKPILVFEGGENLRYDAFSIQKSLEGLQRVLNDAGMLPDSPVGAGCLHFEKSQWLRAPRSGIFRAFKSSGEQVDQDEPLGIIYAPFGDSESQVVAKNPGHILGHSNATLISQGDALFHIGFN